MLVCSNSKISIRILLLFFLCSTSVLQAQEVVESMEKDPLRKPNIWEKLKEDPSSDELWFKYFGKDLFELSQEEYKSFQEWQSGLQAQKQRLHEESQRRIAARKLSHSRRSQTNKYLLEEYYNLADNINKNFDLIDDYFAREFKALNYHYDKYKDMFPEDGFPKEQWVRENQQKLIKLKSSK